LIGKALIGLTHNKTGGSHYRVSQDAIAVEASSIADKTKIQCNILPRVASCDGLASRCAKVVLIRDTECAVGAATVRCGGRRDRLERPKETLGHRGAGRGPNLGLICVHAIAVRTCAV
jgi:hypothetical protein